jgi:predicted nucleotidyltransferase
MHTGEEYGAEDISRIINADRTTVLKALGYLEADGLVVRRAVGKKFLYSVVTKHPFYPEIRGIAIKSFGGLSEVTTAISGDKKIVFAAVFGSFARGAETSRSDIDVLFVIEDEGWEEEDYKIATVMAGVGDRVAREVHPAIYSRSEFARLRGTRSQALLDILASPMIAIKGDIADA